MKDPDTYLQLKLSLIDITTLSRNTVKKQNQCQWTKYENYILG